MGCAISKMEDGNGGGGGSKKKGKKVKILLLGAGEAGKSTIAKQMKIMHLRGFSEEEVSGYRKLILQNVCTNMKVLVQGAGQLGYKLDDPDGAKNLLLNQDFIDGNINGDIASQIKKLWVDDQGIRQAFQRASEIHLVESAQYYFEHLDRLLSADFKPNYEDILKSRRLTVGAEEIEFFIDGYTFHVIDVGGQKGEREKWVDYFQRNDAVIFFAALSEYDQKLVEDNSTNRMHESLKLFSDVCNHQWFADAAIIVFLNKSDIFQEKIKKIPLTVAFPEYKDKNEFGPASEFIKQKFIDKINNKRKQVYPYITCATNTENFKTVFAFVKDLIIGKQMREIGI